jgi:hypothetical protein
MIYYLISSPSGTYVREGTRCNLATPREGKFYTTSVGFPNATPRIDADDEAAAATALGLTLYNPPALTPQQALAAAIKSGIDVTLGGTTYRLKCGESDRNAFSQRATLFLTAQEFMTGAQKTAHRASATVIVDAAGQSHTLTVGQYQQLILAYGAAFDALWTAAAA